MDAGSSPRTCSTSAAATSEAYLDALLRRCRARGTAPDATYFDSPRCAVARGVDGGSTSPRSGDVDETVDGAVIRRPRSISQRGSARRRRAAAAASAWDQVRRVVERWTAPALALSGLMDPTTPPPSLGDAGETTAVGCVTAMPGAPRQHFHADGRIRGIVNCFAPLVHLPARLGPTRFKRGSHAWNHDAPYLTRAEERAREAAEEVAPELARGALLVYDYRTMHAGGANESDDERRPVAYVMRSRRGLEDTWNFPEESVWDEGEGGGES